MRVLVLGGGYAGVTLTRELERRLPERVELLLVDDTGEHLIQHELHRAIRRPSLVEHLLLSLHSLFDRAQVVTGEVVTVDPENGRVRLADGTALEYDVGAICLGASPADYGIPGVGEHGTPLKCVDHAMEIRERFLDVLDAGGSVVVGGAGLTGVQVAGELAALTREENRTVSEDVRIRLVEQEDVIAPGFDDAFQTALRRALVARGIDVRTGTTVAGATERELQRREGGPIACDQLVWTGGIAGTEPLSGERPTVDARLTLTDRTLALGDAARVIDVDGDVVPASAQAAIREARTAAVNVERLVDHERDGGVFEPRLERFDFDALGWVVSVGNGAVATVGPSVVTGRAARAIKTTIDASYLGSIGAIQEAVDVVYDELGITRSPE